jgi:pyrimidine-specific ribonucleoside hydrolase
VLNRGASHAEVVAVPRRPVLSIALAACAAGLVGGGCSSGGDPGASPDAPVILSTDLAMGLSGGEANGTSHSVPDVDDAWALALAESDASLDVSGIAVTMGNAMVADEVAAAEATVGALGGEAPVTRGASVWLAPRPVSLTGEGERELTGSCVNDGVRMMVDQLREGPRRVVAIGPVTDLACLVLEFPDEAERIEEIVVLAGSAPGEELTFDGDPVHDFNVFMDPRAFQVVLSRSEIPFTAITYSASSKTGVPVERILALRESDDARARFFGEASAAYAEFWREAIGPDKPIWDAAAVWRLIRPEAFECQQAGYRVRLATAADPDADPALHLSPEYDDTRQVTACTGWSSEAEIDRMNDAIFAAVGED